MDRSGRVERAAIAWLVILIGCGACLADDATKAVEQVFGQELKRVRATQDPRDDAALAGDLLKAASTSTNNPALLAALCETAYTLAMKHPTGYATAVAAMELLAAEAPQKDLACRERILEVRRKQYYTSKGAERKQFGELLVKEALTVVDAKEAARQYSGAAKTARLGIAVANLLRSPLRAELQARLKRLAALERVETQVRQFEVRLKAKPDDAVARSRLILLNLVDLDRPEKAGTYLTPDCDEMLRTYIPLTAKSDEDLPEGACVELGNWYRSLAGKATTVAKPPMLRRARKYYELFLGKHADEDLARTKVELALKRVEAELEKLDQSAPGDWKDILRSVVVAKHTTGGPWSRKGAKVGMTKLSIELPIKVGTLMFPVVPKGSYELHVSFARTQGTGPVGVYLPIGSTRITLAMSMEGGEHSALDKIGGESDGDNKTITKPGKLINGRETTVDAKVIVRDKDKEGEIDIKLNGQKYLYWKGPLTDLSRGNEPDIGDANAPGMATLNSRFVVSRARIRMLSGQLAKAEGTTGGPIRDPLREFSEERRREWQRRAEDWWRRRRGPRR